MKILYLAHAVFLDPTRVTAGNSVRAWYLTRGLAEAGHEVVFAYPQSLSRYASARDAAPMANVREQTFDGAAALNRLVADERPDVLLVGYWELLEQLTEPLPMPVVLDVVAPRVLEVMFQQPQGLSDEIARMLAVYRKADLFLAGNQRQAHFLLPWLIMAGFDCRFEAPVTVLPISTQACEASPGAGTRERLRLVSGGVAWPWRRTEAWFDAVVAALLADPQRRGRLALFAGDYIYADAVGDGHGARLGEVDAAAGSDDPVERHGLLAYAEMQGYLESNCDVGIELADHNTERAYSQSFRAMEFLRAGLPLLCNRYLELADHVRAHDAGWVVDTPEEAGEAVREMLAHPERVREKAANARRMVDTVFDYRVTIRPLLRWLEAPARCLKGPLRIGGRTPAGDVERGAVVTLDSGVPAKLKRFAQRALAAGKRRGLGVARRIAQTVRRHPGGDEVIMVSRSDVFPADHGAAVKIDRTAAALSRQVGCVYLVTDDRAEYHVYRDGVREVHRFPAWMRWLAPPRSWVRHRALNSGIPVGDAFMYFPLFDFSYIVRTLFLAARHPVGVFQAEFPAYARACCWGRSVFGGKVVLVEHNVEYQRLRDQEADLSERGHAFLKRVELALCMQADRVIAVSERDRATLVAEGVSPDAVVYIPHGVDLQAFDEQAALDVRQRFGIDPDRAVLVYHGTYLYPPNLEAMRAFAERVLPRLRARGVRVTLLAIGNHPPAQPLDPDIVFTGSLPSVAPALKAADLAVVPLLKGGGTRMKILDYFAARLPVVSTAKGIEGIPVRDGEHAIVVDTPDEAFADAVVALLSDRERARTIAANGRGIVEDLDWNRIAQRYLASLRDC